MKNIFLIIIFLTEFAKPCFSEDTDIMEFKSYVSNALSSIQKHSALLVTASNSLWFAEGSGTNHFERTLVSYLTSGQSCRTICKWPDIPFDGLNEWQDSYNGIRSATFSEGKPVGTISYQGGKRPDEPVAPINPILSHLIFLSRAGDSCPLCVLRVNDVVDGDPFRTFEKYTITNASAGDAKISTFFLPSERINQSAAYWIIKFDKTDSVQKIISATRSIDDGKVRLVYGFSNYTNLISENANLAFPTTVTMEDYHGSDLIMTGMTQVISAMVNPPIPTNAFDIVKDLDSRAKVIINADTEQFDRKPSKYDSQNLQFAKKRKVILLVFPILSLIGLWVLWKNSKK